MIIAITFPQRMFSCIRHGEESARIKKLMAIQHLHFYYTADYFKFHGI